MYSDNARKPGGAELFQSIMRPAEVDEMLRREFEPLFGLTTAQTVGKTSNEPALADSERSVSVPSR